MQLVKMRACDLRLGQPFALTADGKFADAFGDWGYTKVAEVDPETGRKTGRKVRALTYVGLGGYRDVILWDAVVYADPMWNAFDASL